jgi:hypothetical protein
MRKSYERIVVTLAIALAMECPVASAWADEPPARAADGPSSDDLGGLPATDPSEPQPLTDPEASRGARKEAYDPTPAPQAKRNDAPGFVLLGLGAGGIGLGIAGVFVAARQGTLAERDAAAIKKAGGFCQPVTPGLASKCSAVADEADKHNTWQKVGRGAFAVGVACALAGLVYLVWPEGRPGPKKRSAMLTPFAAPGEGGLSLSGVLE